MSFPTPPIPVPAGWGIAWSSPTTGGGGSADAGASNGSFAVNPPSCTAILTSSCPLCNYNWVAWVTGFSPVSIPAGARIKSIIPVGVVTTLTAPIWYLQYGYGFNGAAPIGGIKGTSVTGFPGSSASSPAGQYNGPSLGTDISTLPSICIGVSASSSAPLGAVFFEVTASAYVAVYYETLPSPVVNINVGNTKRYPS